jgi:flagellar basal-body rod modification protein FlgD
MITAVTRADTTSSNDSSGSTSSTTSSSTSVDKNMFLQLLVAQLQNQDPLNPADGTQFIGELAQFQQLEQSINTGEDITALRTDVESIMASIGVNSSTSTTTDSTVSQS